MYAEKFEFDSFMEESNINLKAVDMNLRIMLRSIFFQDNSEFRNKFADVHNRILEFGINVKWASEFKGPIKKITNENANSSDKGLLLFLIGVLILGISVSLITFVVEILRFHFHTF